MAVEAIQKTSMRVIYDQEWHDEYGDATRRSAEAILPYLIGMNGEVRSILEVGCGHGHWLQVARSLGIEDITGIDGAWTNSSKLRFPAERFVAGDIGQKIELGRRFDLVISLEVGEHLGAAESGELVDNLVRHGDVILFGAAIPYQGGFRHINEQWPTYWRALFSNRGYLAFDVVRPVFWMNTSVLYYYRQNALLYVNEAEANRVLAYQSIQRSVFEQLVPLDLVHPEKFEQMASYDAIVLKRLVGKLPAAILRMLRRKAFMK